MTKKIHPTALVESLEIGDGTSIWAFVHVMHGARLGSNVNIGDHTFVEGGAVIGNNVTIKNQVCIWEGIEIEDDCFIGPRVTFTNDKNPRSPRMLGRDSHYGNKENWLSRTLVRRGCSIGAAATICPGLHLGPCSMIAAGAVVTEDVPAFACYAGVPARHLHDVCRCGKKLTSSYRDATCESCGETAFQRTQWLAQYYPTEAVST